MSGTCERYVCVCDGDDGDANVGDGEDGDSPSLECWSGHT